MGRRGPAPAKDAAQKRKLNVCLAMRRYRATHRSRINARRNASNARKQEIERRLSPPPEEHIFVTNKFGLHRPSLFWMDAHGTLHAEDTRSAEEVIQQWRKSNAKLPA